MTNPNPNATYTQVAKAHEHLTGERWCSECQRNKKTEGGAWKVTRASKRWLCGVCAQRRGLRG